MKNNHTGESKNFNILLFYVPCNKVEFAASIIAKPGAKLFI